MNTRRNLLGMLIVFCTMFAVLCAYLVYIINAYGTRWFTSPYNTRFDTQRSNVVAGDILDRNDYVLATTGSSGARVYSSESTVRRATAHVVGDSHGQTLGAESFFSQYLLGLDRSLSERMQLALSGNTAYGSNVKLTIDKDLCVSAYRALGDYNGAIVLLNYKTGEVLCSVSKPTFDPKYMEDYLSNERKLDEGAMVNRVNSGKYTPGSVFKIITVTAALRYLGDVQARTFSCEGPLVFDPQSESFLTSVTISPEQDEINKKESEAGHSGEYLVVRDYNGDYHGELDLKTAFSKSCNHVFASLAVELGKDRLARTAKDLSVGEDFLFSDLVTAASSFVKGSSDYTTAWSGVGQYKDTLTPLHMCMITGAIANGGYMMEPKLLLDVTNREYVSSYMYSSKVYKSLFTPAEAEVLSGYMLETVKSGTGKNAAIKNYSVAGKTGTAEVGSGESKPNAWFTGFVLESPLAVCVVVEKGGSGGSTAAPIAATVLKKALNLGY